MDQIILYMYFQGWESVHKERSEPTRNNRASDTCMSKKEIKNTEGMYVATSYFILISWEFIRCYVKNFFHTMLIIFNVHKNQRFKRNMWMCMTLFPYLISHRYLHQLSAVNIKIYKFISIAIAAASR